jgi:hypothetical protein
MAIASTLSATAKCLPSGIVPNMWRTSYRGTTITGNSGQPECIAHHETDKFTWQTLHKSLRSAKICITKTQAADKQARIVEQAFDRIEGN